MNPNYAAIDDERAVIGAMIYHGAAAADVAACYLRASHFYLDDHARIFACITSLAEDNDLINYKTVAKKVTKEGVPPDTDIEAYTCSLAYEYSCAISNIAYHSKTIKEKARQRKILSAINTTTEDILADNKTSKEVISDIEGEISNLFEPDDGGEAEVLDSMLPKSCDEIDGLWSETAQGIPTGFEYLDKLIGGLRGGNLLIIGGRPSMGKTAFALSIARHVAIKTVRVVAFFSLEMNKREIRDRIMAAEAHIDLGILANGNIPKRDRNKLLDACQAVDGSRIIIDDTASCTVHEIRAKSRRIKSKYGLDLIVVDYLQIITPSGRQENTVQEITKISRALKILAKELNVPVIALAQLSRAVEQRKGNHRPLLSDLRESGAIEQDADVVMFVYREEVYHRDDPALSGKAEIIVSKNRNGATGVANVAFVNKYASFENLSDDVSR